MADRYWVGGSGTWNTSSTTNWSTSSGGASGASAPTASDNVFFDSNSNVGTGAFTVTVSAAVCNDFNAPGTSTALDGTMTLALAASTLTVSGSWTNQATNFNVSNAGGSITFNATTTGKTITTNGVTIVNNITLNGVGGAWTLGSALNMSTGTLNFTAGTFDTSASNYSLTCQNFNSSNSNTRTINLNASTLTLGGNWTMTTSTNATLNAGTSTIALSGTSLTFDGGGLTYYNVSFTSTTATTSIKTISSANTFNNLTFSTIASAGLNNVPIGANQTINGTLTVNGSNGNRRMFVRSDTIGTTRTLTCAAIAAMTDVDFRDITIAGAAGTLSGTRLGDCGGNSNITFVAGTNKYWNLAAGGNWNATAWATSSGGGVADTNYPLPQDTAIIENTGLTASNTITINGAWNIGTLDLSTRTNAMTLASSSNLPTFYGNFTYGSGVTPTGTGTYTFNNRSTKTLDSGGKTFTQPITINAPSGGIQLVTNNLTLGTTLTTTLTQGTLDLNNLTLTTGVFNTNNTNTRTIAFGTGNISCSGTGVVWNTSTVTNLTTTGTQVVNVTSVGSSAISVYAGQMSEANSISFNFTGGTYALLFGFITGTPAVRNLNFTGYAGTFTIDIGANTAVYGNLTLSTGMTVASSTATMTFGATSGTQLITTNGKTLDFPITFNGVGGTFKLQDAMTLGTTRTATLTNGTLDLNNLTLTTSLFSSSNSNARTIAFGTLGQITLTGNNATVWTTSTTTNFSSTGTFLVVSNYAGATGTRTFTLGALAVDFKAGSASGGISFGTAGTDTVSVTGTAIKDLDTSSFTGTFANATRSLTGNLTIGSGTTVASGTSVTTFAGTTGTQQITSNGKTLDFPVTFNGVGGTFRLQDAMTVGSTRTTTLTNGTLDLNNLTLTTGLFSSSNSNTRIIAFGTGNISCSGTGAVWSTTTVTNLTTTGTQVVNVTSAGSTAISVAVTGLSEANAISFNFTGGTYALSFSASSATVRNLNFTGYAGTLAEVLLITIYGNLTLSTGMSLTASTFAWTFGATSGTQQITTNGKTLNFPITFNGVGGTFSLQDAMTLGSTRTMTLTNGTLNLNGNTCTVGTRFTTATGTKNLTFNGGTLVCPDPNTTSFNNASPTNFTTTAGTGTGTISMTAATAKTFVGGGSTYNCTLNQGGAGALTITGSNTFDNITNTTQPASVLFTAGTTSTFLSGFSLSGTAGNLITIDSATAASHTLSKASGTVSVSYCSISRSSATGGAIWQAFTSNGNVDGGNNTGWIFTAPSAATGNFLMFF